MLVIWRTLPTQKQANGVGCDLNTRESYHCVETMTATGTVRTHMRTHKGES